MSHLHRSDPTTRVEVRLPDGRFVELPVIGPVTLTFTETPPRRPAGKRRVRAQQLRRRDRRTKRR